MSFVKEFREFAVKGNVIDMAVGIVIGVAFGKIVSSLVSDVVTPPLGYIIGGVDFTKLAATLPANQAVCLHADIDYAFVQVGAELLIMAEKLVESVTKACNLPAYTIIAVKKGGEGFEALETQRPLTTGLSPILLGDFVTLEQGTGCVHIAPGHGMEDYLLVLDHNAKASVTR